jgi:hypothetical protein
VAKTNRKFPTNNYGLRLEKALLLGSQHLALDEDHYVTELIEEAMRLKKYREKQVER